MSIALLHAYNATTTTRNKLYAYTTSTWEQVQNFDTFKIDPIVQQIK